MISDMAEVVRVEVLRTAAKLEELRAEWIELWERDARAKPFQRPEWLLPWWRQFGTEDLRAVTMRRGVQMIGFLPLYVYREPRSGERQLLLLGAGTSDYLDGVFAAECGVEEVLRALELLRAEGGWDVAHLTQLAPGSVVLEAMERLEREQGAEAVRRYAGESCSRCAALPVRELPAKLRKEVLYRRNAAISRGRLELAAAEPSALDEVFGALVRMHTERWRQAGESGVLAEAAVLAWHREALPELLAAGLLRLMALRLEGEIVAVLYSLIDPERIDPELTFSKTRPERTQYFYLMGYALAERELQPGTLLTAMASERAAAEGVRILDMLRGDEAYKRFWHVEPVAMAGFAMRRELPRPVVGGRLPLELA